MSFGAIFDMDGTLLDSMPLWQQVAEAFLNSHGCVPLPGMMQEIESLDMKDTSSYLKEKYCLTESVEEIITELNNMVAHGYRETVALKRDVLPFLNTLKEAGVVMCIATATERHLAEVALEHAGLSSYFHFMLTAHEDGGKDRPEIFLEACRRLGTKRENTIVFEDAFYAVETAKKAGFCVVAIQDASASAQEEKIREFADFYIHQYEEVSLEWLKSQKKH